MEVQLPLPFVIAAAGYLEKYGPDERYNYLHFIHSLRFPALITLGTLEAADNMAFRGAAEALVELQPRCQALQVAMVPGADHFYSSARTELLTCLDEWLRGLGTKK
jgi:hypothetical protein